jgi:hypothetical protein
MSRTSGQMFSDFPLITANYCGTLRFLFLVCLDTKKKLCMLNINLKKKINQIILNNYQAFFRIQF